MITNRDNGPRSAEIIKAREEIDDAATRTISSSEDTPSPRSDGADTTDELDLTDLFSLLRNSRRRRALRYLFTTDDGTATIGELSEHIAAIENDTETSLVSSKQRKRVYIGLYQTHLPQLAALGVIEYERSRGTVMLLDKAEQLKPHLFITDTEVSWKRWLGAAFIVCCLVLVGLTAAYYSVGVAAISLLATVGAYIGATLYQ